MGTFHGSDVRIVAGCRVPTDIISRYGDIYPPVNVQHAQMLIYSYMEIKPRLDGVKVELLEIVNWFRGLPEWRETLRCLMRGQVVTIHIA